MHIHFLDPYQAGSSVIHKLDARILFIIVVSFILTVSLTPPGAWPAYILLYSLILTAEILSGLGISYFLKRSLLAIPFLLAALPILFTMEGSVIIAFDIWNWNLSVSQAGLERFISIVLKSWISIQAAILLAACIPFPQLLLAMRAVKVPRMLVSIFGLMWRYLFVLADEAIRLMRARAARSGASQQNNKGSGGSLKWRGIVTGGMVGSLLLRAYERSDRIYAAMVSRGYDGEIRSFPLPGITVTSYAFLIVCLSLFAILLIFSNIFW